MLYNLRNGKTIELSTEEFFSLKDEDLDQLEGMELGEHIENPFHGSALGSDKSFCQEEIELPLTQVPADVKRADRYFSFQD